MSTSTAPAMNGSPDRIEATRLNGTFGARIDGIDLSRPLASQAIERLKELLREHKVLTFRDQFAVGPNELLAFAQRFGTPEAAPHPTHADFPGLPGVKVLVSDAEGEFYEDSWHTMERRGKRPACSRYCRRSMCPRMGEHGFRRHGGGVRAAIQTNAGAAGRSLGRSFLGSSEARCVSCRASSYPGGRGQRAKDLVREPGLHAFYRRLAPRGE